MISINRSFILGSLFSLVASSLLALPADKAVILASVQSELQQRLLSEYPFLNDDDLQITLNSSALVIADDSNFSRAKVRYPSHNKVLGRLSLPVFFYNANEELVVTQHVISNADAKATFYYLKDKAHRYELVDKGLFESRLEWMYGQPDRAIRDIGLVSGQEFKYRVSKGSILSSDMLQAVPVIRCQGKVFAILKSGGVEVKAKAVALEDGNQGDLIRVKALLSQKELQGRVMDDQTVFVTFLD
ncbi:MAG: flagella basal body P-ring formation protein FlgA [Actinobacteria bacterium]|nr:flagella basal body P-ring formation protein FlgA [Actinomycetota bacterium]